MCETWCLTEYTVLSCDVCTYLFFLLMYIREYFLLIFCVLVESEYVCLCLCEREIVCVAEGLKSWCVRSCGQGADGGARLAL